MKGITVEFECQLCGKKLTVSGPLGTKISKPPGWASRGLDLNIETAQLYPGWKGAAGPDVLPRLFCTSDHLSAFVEIEKVAGAKANAEALEVARKRFHELLKPAKLRAMDAVTALATAVTADDADPQ